MANGIIKNTTVKTRDFYIQLPEGAQTRAVENFELSNFQPQMVFGATVISAATGGTFHVQTLVISSDGTGQIVYDKSGTNSYSITVRVIYI